MFPDEDCAGEGRDQAPPGTGGLPRPRSWPSDGPASLGRRLPRRRVAARGHTIRPAGETEPDDGLTWVVVVLDRDGDPVDAVTGFTSLTAADDYAQFNPDIVRWPSVPSRPGIPAEIAGI